jgi:hypothetical protein
VNGTNDKVPYTEEPRDRKTITRGSVVAVGRATGPLTHSGADSAYRRSLYRGPLILLVYLSRVAVRPTRRCGSAFPLWCDTKLCK